MGFAWRWAEKKVTQSRWEGKAERGVLVVVAGGVKVGF